MKIEYIDNKRDMGIKYDFKAIKSRIRKLKLYPKDKDVWNPYHVPFDNAKWFTFMSIRSKGKTTSFLIMGLVMYEMYGTVTQYIRQNDYLLTPKYSKGLYNIVNSCGYVPKITGGRWDAVVLKARRWYYCKYDDNGKIAEMSKDYVCIMTSIDKQNDNKSLINEPRGDLIIYDEFINKYYLPDEFIELSQLISSIRRIRKSPIIVLLSNTVDINSLYFNELEISDTVYHMEAGDRNIITSSGGTNVYVEIIDPSQSQRRIESDRLFFGFKNKMLGAITGSTLWAENNYPHIIRDEKTHVIARNLYIKHNNKLVNLELSMNRAGLVVNCHWATKTYDDSIIYTLGTIVNTQYRYKQGYTRLDKLVWNLYTKNKFYYATNDVGGLVSSYLIQSKMQ